MLRRDVTVFALMGICYLATEVTYTAVVSGSPSLIGQSSLWMFLVGGFLGVVLGKFSKGDAPFLRRSEYRVRVVVGWAAIVLVEFLSGLLLNRVLGFGLWDYSKYPFNLMGQICLYYSAMWLVYTPFVFWLSAVIGHYVMAGPRPLPLWDYYVDLFRRDTVLDD